MNVMLAKTAGFCFGVKRAVDTVYQQIEKNDGKRKIYTYGPIIHNMEVVNELKEKGVFPVAGENEIPGIRGQVLIIRSHGVSRTVYDIAGENDIEIVDATCPFVKKIHEIVYRDSMDGSQIVIIGDSAHPEVRGIIGWAVNGAEAVNDEEQAAGLELDPDKKVTIVSQTTFNSNKFNNIVEIIRKKGYDIRVKNTICNATRERQTEAASISAHSDVMLVVGDRHSSNTQKLFSICRSYCEDTYYIQTIEDLDEQILQSGISVGITAGASTPNNIIQEVFLTCQKKKISTR